MGRLLANTQWQSSIICCKGTDSDLSDGLGNGPGVKSFYTTAEQSVNQENSLQIVENLNNCQLQSNSRLYFPFLPLEKEEELSSDWLHIILQIHHRFTDSL